MVLVSEDSFEAKTCSASSALPRAPKGYSHLGEQRNRVMCHLNAAGLSYALSRSGTVPVRRTANGNRVVNYAWNPANLA